MVKTFKIYSPPPATSNDGLVDKYIKWNNNNYPCIILNVDGCCLDSPVRSGFDGIIRNIFSHYLAGFSGLIQGSSDILYAELYAIYKNLLLVKDRSIDELVYYSNSLYCAHFIKGPKVKCQIHAMLIKYIKELLSQSNISPYHTLREDNQFTDFHRVLPK
jgi:hypothetical protein